MRRLGSTLGRWVALLLLGQRQAAQAHQLRYEGGDRDRDDRQTNVIYALHSRLTDHDGMTWSDSRHLDLELGAYKTV